MSSKFKGMAAADIGAAPATTEALTIPVDYVGSAFDPPVGTVFTTQQQVDRMLAGAGETAFQHMQKVCDALPHFLSYDVTITCAAGVHRPATNGDRILIHKINSAGGSLKIVGDTNATTPYSTIHAGGVVTAHQTFDEITGTADPYLDFAGSTFPNDGSLQGRYAITSDGYIGLIWDHTDSRLWVLKKLSPVPTDGVTTCYVGEPSTVFVNSLDDLTNSHAVETVTMRAAGVIDSTFLLEMSDITIRDFGSINPLWVIGKTPTICKFDRILIDKTAGPLSEGGFGIRTQQLVQGIFNDCCHLATVGGGADEVRSEERGESVYITSYFQGMSGLHTTRNNSQFTLICSAIRGCGSSGNNGALVSSRGASILLRSNSKGAVTTFIDTPSGVPAVEYAGRGFHQASTVASALVRFRNNGGPCVRVKDSTVDYTGQSAGYRDDGGNADVGIEIVGPNATVVLTADTDVTGANGDVRWLGAIETYADIVVNGPFVDLANFNKVSKT